MHNKKKENLQKSQSDLCPNLGGPRWNTAITFGMKKLEWCGYPMVKIFGNMITRFDRIKQCDVQRERHHITA